MSGINLIEQLRKEVSTLMGNVALDEIDKEIEKTKSVDNKWMRYELVKHFISEKFYLDHPLRFSFVTSYIVHKLEI